MSVPKEIESAREWLRGERSMCNLVPEDPRETWVVRIAEADAAMVQKAYWTLRAYQEGLMTFVIDADDHDEPYEVKLVEQVPLTPLIARDGFAAERVRQALSDEGDA